MTPEFVAVVVSNMGCTGTIVLTTIHYQTNNYLLPIPISLSSVWHHSDIKAQLPRDSIVAEIVSIAVSYSLQSSDLLAVVTDE